MPNIPLPVSTGSPLTTKQDKPASPSLIYLSLPVRSEGQKRDEDPDKVPKSGLPLHTWSPLLRGNRPKELELSLLHESSQIPQLQSLATLQKPARPDIIEPLEPQEPQEHRFAYIISLRLKNCYRKQVEQESELDKSLQLIYQSVASKETSIVPALVKAHNLVAKYNEEELRKTNSNSIKTIKEGGNQYTIPLTQTPSGDEQNITIIDKATGHLYMATFLKQDNGSYKMQCSNDDPESHDKPQEQLFTKMCELVQAEGHIVNVTINSKSIANVFGYPNLDTLNKELQPGPNRSPARGSGSPIEVGVTPPSRTASS